MEAGNSRIAGYRDIHPGSYRFRVIACNSDGIWNNSGASFEFLLRHKFYQTLPFKIGLPLFVLVIIFLF